jgi:peptidyl-prolyl cis-trans isomerase B (cyclophilin B)
MFIDKTTNASRRSRFIGERIVTLLKELCTLRGRARSMNIAPLCGAVVAVLFTMNSWAVAQNPVPNTETLKKANTRPPETAKPKAEPFDGAAAEKMAGQCVTLDTEQGVIVIEVLPQKALESSRNFLNLAATGALDTTVFSRAVKGFVIQGGNLSTSERWSEQLAERMSRRLPDEPSDLKHIRGMVSMARSDEPNSATTHFFILVGDGPHLDGKFAAFGRVLRGMEVADAINRAPAENEKPEVPVRIKTATVAACIGTHASGVLHAEDMRTQGVLHAGGMRTQSAK